MKTELMAAPDRPTLHVPLLRRRGRLAVTSLRRSEPQLSKRGLGGDGQAFAPVSSRDAVSAAIVKITTRLQPRIDPDHCTHAIQSLSLLLPWAAQRERARDRVLSILLLSSTYRIIAP